MPLNQTHDEIFDLVEAIAAEPSLKVVTSESRIWTSAPLTPRAGEPASRFGNMSGDHAHIAPTTFEADTPCDHAMGVTHQGTKSETLGRFELPRVPGGSRRPTWLPKTTTERRRWSLGR
jgi:hypothetical protein